MMTGEGSRRRISHHHHLRLSISGLPLLAVVASSSELTYGVQNLHGRKCGVAVSSLNEGGGQPFSPQMLREGAALGLGWQTDWSSSYLQPGFQPSDYGEVKLVPQFWGRSDDAFEQVRGPLSTIVLGFNEPDREDMGGSGLSVERALELWMEQVPKARAHGYQEFVAPSISLPLPEEYTGLKNGSTWLPRFLQGCLEKWGCKDTINYLGFHLYEPYCTRDLDIIKEWNMKKRVESLDKLRQVFNKKGMHIKGLWLTEFAGRSDKEGKCRSQKQQLGWMLGIVPLLNAHPAVVAYSWFSYGKGRSPFFHDNANLWDYHTGELNLLGRAYFQVCTGLEPDAEILAALEAPDDEHKDRVSTREPVHANSGAIDGIGDSIQAAQPTSSYGGASYNSESFQPLLDPARQSVGGNTESAPSRTPVLVFLSISGVAIIATAILCWLRHKGKVGRGSANIPACLADAAEDVKYALYVMRSECERLSGYKFPQVNCPECESSCELLEEESETLFLTPLEEANLEDLERVKPDLAKSSRAILVAMMDRHNLDRKGTRLFQAFRLAILGLPHVPSPTGRGGIFGRSQRQKDAGAELLDLVPSKPQILQFLVIIADRRQVDPNLVGEVCKVLQRSMTWEQAIGRLQPELKTRIRALRNRIATV